MNKAQGYLDGMMGLLLMAYGIGLALGDAVRERVFGGSRRYRLYSGLFVLLKLRVSYELMREIVGRSLPLFPQVASPGVPTHV